MNTSGIVLLTVAGGIGLAVVGMALNIITIPWLKLGRQVETERGIIDRTYNADNAIYNYEWFKNRSQEIKAVHAQGANAQASLTAFEASAGPRTTWTFEDKTEHARLSAVVLGLRNHYESIVAEYNARASQVNRAIFKEDLTFFFSLQPF
jgi:hypothetical protein